MYQHFLQTRFNLRRHPLDKFGHETLTDEWMENRFILFEKFCIPSIFNQSVSNFQWLVYFEENTKPEFREKIARYEEQIPNFIPKFVSFPHHKDYIRESVKALINDSTEYVITTRIDNDDIVHRDFMLEIQKRFDYQYDSFFRFLKGYQWHRDTCVLLKMYEKSGNHFSSRIEKVEKGIDTVINVDNQKYQEIPGADIVDIDENKRLWIEVVHDTNVRNHHRVLMPEFNTSIIGQIDIDLEINWKNMMCMLYKYLRKSLSGWFSGKN